MRYTFSTGIKSFSSLTPFVVILFLIPACNYGSLDGETQDLTILYTSDEHGWLADLNNGTGAAELVGLWQSKFNSEDQNILIFSGGDNWTGPAVSTWYSGESMVEVMNSMGYTASAVGNHEFDFGLSELKERTGQAEFPYLAANLRNKKDGKVPVELGIQPFKIFRVGNIQVGIIGLASNLTPEITKPSLVENFNFLDYSETLNEIVPVIKNQGADIVVLISHICSHELARLAWQVRYLDIDIMGAGHCHELHSQQIAGTIIISGGSNYSGFGFARLKVNSETGQVISQSFGTGINQGGNPDPQISSLIEKWLDNTNAELGMVIGYLNNEISRQSREMETLITQAWLAAFPEADVAVTNQGGIRSHLPSGEITPAHIVSVLPFNNTLVEVRLTGEQLTEFINSTHSNFIGGLNKKGNQWFLEKNGKLLETQKIYQVLVNDFMYEGGDEYDLLAQYDPYARYTAIGWREPVIEWILSQRSDKEKPLDEIIQNLGFEPAADFLKMGVAVEIIFTTKIN